MNKNTVTYLEQFQVLETGTTSLAFFVLLPSNPAHICKDLLVFNLHNIFWFKVSVIRILSVLRC